MEDQRKQFLVQTPFFGGLDGPSLDHVIEMLVERIKNPESAAAALGSRHRK